MKKLFLPLLMLFAQLPFISATAVAAENPFPLREIYPKVEIIELEDLYAKLGKVSVVDVRSSYEYETLHLKGATNIPLSDPNFAGMVGDLRSNQHKPIVFYCNGKTCKKSYKAWTKADGAGIDDIYTFDAGIFDWSKAHPEEAVLLGSSPIKPNALLSDDKFQAHLLEPKAFASKVGGGSILIDIRDMSQREGLTIFPMYQRSVPLDNKQLKSYIDKAKSQGKTLLVMDAVGKQVRWLQYYLEEEGLKEYYFLKGGTKALLGQ